MEKINRKRPLVFLDVSIDGDPAERMILSYSLILLPRLLKISVRFVQEKKVSALKLGSHYTTEEPFFTLSSKDMWLRADGHDCFSCDIVLRQGTFFGKMVNLEKVYMMESFRLWLTLLLFSLRWSFNSNDIGTIVFSQCYSKLEPKAISFEFFCYVDGTVILERAVLWLAGQKYVFMFVDESPKLKHDGPGLLTMAIDDRDERGSLFYVTFKADHHLDRKSVVFGKLVNGLEVLKKIENAGDEEGRPTVTVKIINSGELLDDKKKGNRLKMGKDSIEENNNEVRRKGKHKKSSKKKRKRRRYYTSESDSSTDTDTESSESDSDSDSYATSLSDTSSSSDDRRKKRKRSKRDRNRRGKRKDRRREKRRKRRDRKTKRKSKRNNASDSESVSKSGSSSEDNAVAGALDGKHKSSGKGRQLTCLKGKKASSRENGDHQSNGIGLEMESDQSADRHPDLVDDHPSKSRSRNLSPRKTMSRSMSISPRRSAHRSPGLGVTHSRSRSRSVSRSPQRISDKSRSNSPVRSGSSRSPIRSPPRSKTGRSSSMSPPVRSPQQSRSRSATISPPRRRVTQSPARTSSRRSLRSASRSPVRSSRRSLSRSSGKPSRRSLSRSPKRSLHRSVSRSSGRAPPRRSPSLSPVRAPGRIVRRSYSRSPVGAGRGRGPLFRTVVGAHQEVLLSMVHPNAFEEEGALVTDTLIYSSYRRSPRRYRSPPRGRTPPRYRGGRRSRTRSPSVSRSPIRYRNRRYSHSRSPVRSNSPVGRYRGSVRGERRKSPSSSRSRSRSESRSSRNSQSPPRRADKGNSRSSSGSSPRKTGLVSYGDGSPDSVRD
ncbi:hypothetical protein DH2020_006123 [Rehmannia glutinosa]|uniref:PPIase cyclophilin-type domain-containing protein n=1 Tax=Rehmannia glutinosa TaxID=99300 RepID=A0ABR0XI00_REHGL